MIQELINQNSSSALRQSHKETVGIGATSTPVMVGLNGPVRVAGFPGGSGTIEFEYTCSSRKDIIADSAKWFSWAAGASATDATEIFAAPVMAVRATALVAAADIEILIQEKTVKIYRDASTVVLDLPFVDESGNPVSPTVVSYRVLSEDNSEIVPDTPITLNGGEVSTIITIDAAENTLGENIRRTLRTVELTLTTAKGIVRSETRYAIESDTTVIVGENSYQTFNESLLTAMDMLSIERWEIAPDRDKRAALSEAYYNIARMSFKTISSLIDLDAASLGEIDIDLYQAIQKAQVSEANYVLGGSSIEDKRIIGLMSETIGETSNMFRPGKPLILPISGKTLQYLGGHISWSVKLGRAQ